ncbi:hypothetical protein [Haloferax sp. ATB1]|uniref:hypothetical protein n=1 Tax=Haloferax sp. ATB1 TaxID=1508454 RepID=UPI0005B20C4E|nr:hypothetical protein [Haloferax sp. ATB1]
MTWTIGTEQGSIAADVLVGETIYTPRVAEEINPTFRFVPNESFPTPETRFEALAPYVRETADTFVRAGRAQGGAFFREDTANLADVDSFLVSIEAPLRYDFASVWGVIVGGRDASNRTRTALRWELDIVVLAPLEDYDSRADVKAALEDVVL